MKKLLALLVLAACLPTVGCKDLGPTPMTPEAYAKQVQVLKSQWKAGRITTSYCTSKLEDLDDRVKAWADDHYVNEKQKTLLASAKK